MSAWIALLRFRFARSLGRVVCRYRGHKPMVDAIRGVGGIWMMSRCPRCRSLLSMELATFAQPKPPRAARRAAASRKRKADAA